MSKILYHYDPKTGLLLAQSIAQIDVKASTDGKIVYMIPPNTTFAVPPTNVGPYRVAKYNPALNSWNIVDDFRGRKVVKTSTKEIITWNEIGAIPKGYTFDIYSSDIAKYVEWNGSGWVISEEGRNLLIEDIWTLRKNIREQECSSDLEYNGHLIHVDATSFNDIMLAAQEALISGDMITTKRWVTADNVDVQLNGSDFINIARLFGERRQRLVYESNEAWQQDMERSDTELVEIFRTLNGRS